MRLFFHFTGDMYKGPVDCILKVGVSYKFRLVFGKIFQNRRNSEKELMQTQNCKVFRRMANFDQIN